MSSNPRRFYEFGPFRLDPSEQQLWRGGEELPLTQKAFKVLMLLVESGGHTLDKNELMQKVWPDAFVEEGRLTDNISTLRKALGDDRKAPHYIKTVPGRGYRFVGEVREVVEEDVALVERSRTRVVIEEETSDAPLPALAPTQEFAPAPESRPAMLNAPQSGWFRSRRAALLGLAAGLAVAGGAAATAWKKLSGSRPEERRAVAAAAVPERSLTLTVVSNVGVEGSATISPDGKFIAYMQNHFVGTGSVYVRQTGTNNEVQLLPPGERIFGTLDFSPDSTHLYYLVFDKQDPKGALYRVPVLGGPARRLFALHTLMFGLSHDGTRVAYFRDAPETGRRHLVVAALDDGSERVLLERNTREMVFDYFPAWSPDGSLIAFGADDAPGPRDSSTKIHAVEVESGAVRRLSNEEWRSVGKMAWTADGRGLIFVGERGRTGSQLYHLSYPEGAARQITSGLNNYGNYGLGVTADGMTLVADAFTTSSHLWAVGADGDAARAVRLTTGDDDGGLGLTTLPDGRILYVATVNGVRDLWVMNGDGTEARPLTADEHTEMDVTATADSRYLVFSSERGGFRHLFRTDVDGSNPLQLTSGESYNGAPDCSPDGRFVVYASSDGSRETIRKIPIDGGESVELIEGAVAPAFSPDGRQVSCIFPSNSVVHSSRIAIIPAEGGEPVKTFDVASFWWFYRGAEWTPDGRSIIYRKMERQKGGLWNLWQQPLAGGEPRPLTNFKTDIVFRYAFTHDGQRIILARGTWVAKVTLIRNFN